jgi:hypothetical protein
MTLPNWQATIVEANGDVVPSAEVEVILEATGLPATIFSDRAGSTPLTNPFFTGPDGFAQFYAAAGEYRITATGSGGTRTWRYEVLLGTGDVIEIAQDEAKSVFDTLIQTPEFAQAINDIIHPVESFYNQYPVADSNVDAEEFPITGRPAALFGGEWDEQWPTESNYFRTRGTDSDTGRIDGRQLDALQDHDHLKNAAGATEVYLRQPAGTINFTAPVTGWQQASSSVTGLISTGRKATENRVTNRRIKVWKRTA